MRKRKNSITPRDKAESHEGLLLIAGLIARHHVKNRLKEIGQNRGEFNNTKESQNIDDTEVQ